MLETQEKRYPILLRIVAILLILIGIFHISAILTLLLLKGGGSPPTFFRIILSIISGIMLIMLMLSGVGLLYKKKWGYYLAIVGSFILVLYVFIDAMFIFFSILGLVFLIYLLSKKTKEFFNVGKSP